MAKQKVALECLSYHATANLDDTLKLCKDTIPSAQEYNLFRWVCYILLNCEDHSDINLLATLKI